MSRGRVDVRLRQLRPYLTTGLVCSVLIIILFLFSDFNMIAVLEVVGNLWQHSWSFLLPDLNGSSTILHQSLAWLCFLTRMTVLCAHIDLWLCLSVCECAFGKCLHLWQLRSTETLRGHAFYFFKDLFLYLVTISHVISHTSQKFGVRKK